MKLVLLTLLVTAAIVAAENGVVVEFSGPSHRIELAADYPGDSPEIHAKIEGHSRDLKFSVDSGSSFTILDTRIAAEFGLKPNGEISMSGAGSGEVKTKLVKNVAFDLSGVRLRNVDVLITDLSGLAEQGHSIDGIFGYDLFSKLVVTMDQDLHKLILTDPANFEYRGAGAVLPITFGGRRGKWIYVPATVRVPGIAPEKLQFFVDTGSSDAVDTELIKKSTAPLGKTQTGNGLGQPGSGVLGRIEWIKLGDFELRNTPSACCGNPGNENMIGGAVLRRFIVTFEYSRKQMILERGKRFKEPF